MPRTKKATVKAKTTVATEAKVAKPKIAKVEAPVEAPAAPAREVMPSCEVCGQEKARISLDREGQDIVLLCDNRDCDNYRLLKRADYDNRRRL